MGELTQCPSSQGVRKSFCGLRLGPEFRTDCHGDGDIAAWLDTKEALSQGCRLRNLPGLCEAPVPSVSRAAEFSGGIFRPGFRFCVVYIAFLVHACVCVCVCIHVSEYMCVFVEAID